MTAVTRFVWVWCGFVLATLAPGLLGAQTLTVESGAGQVNQDIVLAVTLDAEDEVEGWSFEVCDDDLMAALEILDGTAIDEVTFDFHVVEILDGSWTSEAVLDGETISGTELELYRAHYAIGADDGDAVVDFCSAATVTIDGVDETPSTNDGTVTVTIPEFLRGDTNGDGRVEPLLDAYFLLIWAFSSSGPDLPCRDAADCDGNGTNFALLDTLFLLQWGFAEGFAPPDPGPTECGPQLTDSTLSCESPPDPCPGDRTDLDPDADYDLAIGDASGTPDSTVVVDITLDNAGENLLAWQWAICFDDAVVETEEGDSVFGDDIVDLDTIYSSIVTDDDYIIFALLMDVITGEELAAANDLDLYSVFFTIVGEEDDVAMIEFCEAGDPEVFTLLIDVNGEFLAPETTNGTITVVEGNEFMRGDVDANGEVNAILDAIRLLEWGFVNGEEPVCMDSADVDDSGGVVPLLDTIFLLEYGFLNGEVPPDPGPDECGLDPSDDDVSCLAPTGDC